jgi:hypothetical protein
MKGTDDVDVDEGDVDFELLRRACEAADGQFRSSVGFGDINSQYTVSRM